MQTDSSQQESTSQENDDELFNSPIARREKEAALKLAQQGEEVKEQVEELSEEEGKKLLEEKFGSQDTQNVQTEEQSTSAQKEG